MSTPLSDTTARSSRRASRPPLAAAAPALAARAAAALRRAGRRCCSRSITSSSAAPTIRAPSSSAPRSTREAIETSRPRAAASPNAEELDGAAPGLARQRGALPRRPGAAGRQGRRRDPRARDLQGAERGRQQRQAAAGRRRRAARLVRGHRDKYDEPARYDFQEAALSGDSSEAAVRAFVDGAERRHAGRREGRACACSRAGRTPTWSRATAPSSPRRSRRRRRASGSALHDARRLARHAARRDHAGQAGRLRGAARRGAAGLDRRHRWPSSAPPPCARWPRSTRSKREARGRMSAGMTLRARLLLALALALLRRAARARTR